jgi:hypothetical protein
MFDLYQAPAQAAHRQAELYDEIAAGRMARSARPTDQPSADGRPSPASRVIALVTEAMSAVRGTHATAGRRPHWT